MLLMILVICHNPNQLMMVFSMTEGVVVAFKTLENPSWNLQFPREGGVTFYTA